MEKVKSSELAKKFWAENKMIVPRAVFLLLLFCMIMIVFSSAVSGIALSVFTAFAGNSSTSAIGLLLFAALELYLLYFFFIMQYGLFLSCLRFVRKQPVALPFLFVGRKQRRAKQFALFFMPAAIIILVLSMWPFYSLTEFSDPKILLDYFSNNPDAPRRLLLSSAIFFGGAFVFYFPFTFVWPTVYDTYDAGEGGFKKIFFSSLKFFNGRVLNFILFELECHFANLLVFAAANLAEFFLLKYFSENLAVQFASSVLGFVSFLSVTLLAAGLVLSVGFYYDQFQQLKFDDEDSYKKNSD